MHLNVDIEKLLIELAGVALPGIDLSLTRMQHMLNALGDPHLRLPPVIHVAGTNGKGSTIAYMRAIYEAVGYQVHAYTSPHLVHFNERILLAGETISDTQLRDYLQRVLPIQRTIHATVFEAQTAAAFLAFSEHPADLLLLETGLGGRLDATNMVPQPLCTVITPVDIDHTDFLGDTQEKIAAEKAGIMKKNTPCVAAAQQQVSAQVLIQRSEALEIPLLLGGRDWKFALDENGFLLHYREQQFSFPLPNLHGAHQITNAALAAIVARECAVQLPVTETHIAHGITHAQWPGRLQKLTHGPLVEYWGGEVRLDGGHNTHAAHAIAAWIRSQNIPVVMICAMLRRKDAEGYFRELAPVVDAVCCIPIPHEATSYDVQELAEAARTAGIVHTLHAADMLSAAKALQSHRPALLLVAGSLYLAGEVLKIYG